MRRQENAVSDPAVLEDIISSNYICRVALSDGERPYIVAMNYGHRKNLIYLHSALEGEKIEIMKRNNRVCIEICDSAEIRESDKACSYGTSFRSIHCHGRIHFLSDPLQKKEGLSVIMKQHTGRADWDFSKAALEAVAVLKVEIEGMTGKVCL